MLRLPLTVSLLFLFACGDTPETDKDKPVETEDTAGGDEDGDGFRPSDGDCDEANSEVNPGAEETCNGLDDNCDGAVDEGVVGVFYQDADGDGFGDAATASESCDAPSGYVSNNTDCDDGERTTYPDAPEVCDEVDNNCDGEIDEGQTGSWYADADGDGYGDPEALIVACEAPVGAVADNTDCDDTTASAYPGNLEVCDEVDNNCDGAVDEGVTSVYFADFDGDGFGAADLTQNACAVPTGYTVNADDCDDAVAAVNPDATEICNTIDDDCDGTVDEDDASGAITWYADTDADAYGDPSVTAVACAQPDGFVADRTDCDDARSATNPAATEYCNTYDDDCDGTVDEDDASGVGSWYLDADGDTYGNPAIVDISCAQPTGYVADATDCNDGSARAYPGYTESCDSIDNNCDGTVDEDTAVDARTWYADADADTYGNASVIDIECTQPTGYVANATDCDDARAASYPGAPEYCNAYDDDCDGSVDEESALDARTWYADADADTYGNPSVTDLECYVPTGYVANATDCDDTRALTNPGATEYCNTYDDDCDGTVDEDAAADASTWYRDADRDAYGDASVSDISCYAPSGYVADATDCNDGSARAYPGYTESCDSIDNDCDGTVDEDTAVDARTWYRDADADTYGNASVTDIECTQPSGYVANATDCDDLRAASYPGAPEYCNTYDDDCDGTVDEESALDARTWYADADADTYGNASMSDIECYAPTGYVATATDCDDTRALTNPGATEYCNSIDDDCDGTVDEGATDSITWYRDADSDGYGTSTSSSSSCSAPTGYVADSTDCLDTSAISYPGADEICDSLDNDCDGTVDNSPVDGDTYYADADTDGFGDASATVSECGMPSGYIDNDYDCDDTNGAEPVVADPITGSASGTGAIDSPFDSLQDAIDNANLCVVAFGGSYLEQIDLDGKSIDVWGVEGQDLTTIDANLSTCGTSNPTSCGATVTVASGTNATATLHGFTITGGTGAYASTETSTTCADSSASHSGRTTCTVTSYEYRGGGIYVSGDDPVFYDLIVRDNVLPSFEQTAVAEYTQYWMYSFGGGVYLENSNAEFENTMIEGNYADQGGGIFAEGETSFSFAEGYVSVNTATDGGGVNLSSASASFTNAIVHCNVADTDGGGLFTETSGTATFTNTVFYGNTSSVSGTTRGSQAYIGTSTTFNLYNSIVQASDAVYAVYGAGGTGTQDYNNVYNTPGSAYGGTLAAGTGALSSGGNFTAASCDGNPYNDLFSLRSDSTSINAGNPAGAYNDEDGTRNDQGAFGGPGSVWSL